MAIYGKVVMMFALCTAMALGQSVRYDNSVTVPASNVPSGAQAPLYTVPFAKITVCGYPAASNPCTNAVSIYSDQALTQQLTQPIQADGQGRFGFWIAPGQYSYSVVSPSGNPVGTWALTLTGTTPGVGPNGAPQLSNGIGGTKAGVPVTAGFPQQLLGYSGPSTTFTPDGKGWDFNGFGAPSKPIFINNEWWVAVAGYSTPDFNSAQSIGLWHGPNLSGPMTPYAGNPVVTNTIGAVCIEGPDLNVDSAGNVNMTIVGFNTNTGLPYNGCDQEGTGFLDIIRATASGFPATWSALPSTPTIPKPSGLNWLYRGDVAEVSGQCFMAANGGSPSSDPVPNEAVLAYFTTSGTCASTELSGPWTFGGISTRHTQSWEGPLNYELQDPQIFQDPSGLWIQCYGGGGQLTAGCETTLTPLANNWVKLSNNPLQVPSGTGTGIGAFWLPRWTQDSTGQYWMLGNYNNTAGMSVWKAVGPASTNTLAYESNNFPITSTNPAWIRGVYSDGSYNFSTSFLNTYGLNHPFYTSPSQVFTMTPAGGSTLSSNVAGNGVLGLQNFSASGYDQIIFYDPLGIHYASVGLANASATYSAGQLLYNTPTTHVFAYNNNVKMTIAPAVVTITVPMSAASISTLTTATGSTCTVGGYITLIVDGTTRKVAICN